MGRAKRTPSVEEEFVGASLGDERRSARLLKIACSIEEDPSVGFPRAMRSDAELEAFYRFVNSDAFGADAILSPHRAATFGRAEEAGEVLVIHDTTHVSFSGESQREGMGYTTGRNSQGFLAHCSLLLDAGDGTPLGVGHISTLTRSGTKWRNRGNRSQVAKHDAERESKRWLEAVDAVEEIRDSRFEAIHVTDAEGDFFEFLARMQSAGARFVVRASHLTRVVDVDEQKTSLREVVDRLSPKAFRKINIAKRTPKMKKGSRSYRSHPPRKARTAEISIAATRVTMRVPRYTGRIASEFSVNVVRIWEPRPPRGETPIEWVLLTTEAVDTKPELNRVVDIYRRRWSIEEFFKALKTGCALEKRQITSYEGMRKVLSLLAPLAYRLLLYRGWLTQRPDDPARSIFEELDLILLARGQRKPVAKPKTVHEALTLLARLGGHIKNNGAPGWITLGAGLEKLLSIKLGWLIAQEMAGEM